LSSESGGGHGINFDWGLAGARAAAGAAGVDKALVVVDVLSFSTAVTVATGRGTAIYPHAWPSADVEAFAMVRDAAWAVPRREVTGDHPWSLSPVHLLAAPAPRRLVLPSPNGSAIAAASSGRVLAGSLRNATATARWLQDSGYGTADRPVTVIAAGERWPGGELRPALEDLLGAAAIIAAFGPQASRSPEATATEAVWRTQHGHVHEFIRGCLSARELTRHGWGADVLIAADHDAQRTVAVLIGESFRAVPQPWS
jgi:2-phosphosulfolactate phosphatase